MIKNTYFILSILFNINLYAKDFCNDSQTRITDGAKKDLIYKKIKIEDVNSQVNYENKIFFTTSPVYGKPRLGYIDCINDYEGIILKASNFNTAYPDGTDFFKIKDITKCDSKKICIEYYFSKNIDEQEFKNFENKNNLKITTWTPNELNSEEVMSLATNSENWKKYFKNKKIKNISMKYVDGQWQIKTTSKDLKKNIETTSIAIVNDSKKQLLNIEKSN